MNVASHPVSGSRIPSFTNVLCLAKLIKLGIFFLNLSRVPGERCKLLQRYLEQSLRGRAGDVVLMSDCNRKEQLERDQ